MMTVDLSILESLGINLHSNAAAVLSELVANAYDADATQINIHWEQGSRVVVSDDGSGMTADELNGRFLSVGYKKRSTENEGTHSSKFRRPYMGRKGIGKLSVFSIANVVNVYSTKGGISEGFQIDVDDLRSKISEGHEYSPSEVEVPAQYRTQGTTLVLESFRSKRADLTTTALRKRLARRFDVLDNKPPEKGGFAIVINDSPLSYADRQELKKLQFVWEFGQETLSHASLPAGVQRFVIDGTVDSSRGWTVSGWFGTATKPTDLVADEDAGSLKNIIVLARKRPIQEGIIEKLDFSRLFGNYVTGQVSADFLDLDNYDDIATSDRQRLIEDDERVLLLQKFLRAAFVSASETWSAERPKKETTNALDRYPQLRQWIDGLDPWQRQSAEIMIGTIASLDLEKGSEDQRVALFRSGILAFGRVGLRKAATDLDALSKVTAEDLLPLLGRQGEYEAGLWVDILRSRIESISKFQDLANADEKEVVLQKHLFKNLWLLDASWERATASERIEQSLRRMAEDDFDIDDAGKALIGRIDIRYATAGGRHVIVELKRYSINADIDELKTQGGRYAVALRDVLAKTGVNDPDIEVIFVLGGTPKVSANNLVSDRDYIASQLGTIKGRYVIYDTLIGNALSQYEDYLKASDSARNLDALLSSIQAEPNDSAQSPVAP